MRKPAKRGKRARTFKSRGRFRVDFGIVSKHRIPPDLNGLRIRPGRGGIDITKQPTIARRIALEGYDDAAIRAIANVSQETLDYWKATHPDLAEAIESGRTEADVQVVESLFRLATGFREEVEEVAGKDAVRVRYKKYFPPELGAIKTWLYNRNANKWRDKSHVEATGKGGKPLIPKESRAELIASIVRTVRPKPDGK